MVPSHYKLVRARMKASETYFDDQNRRNQARSVDPSIQDMLNYSVRTATVMHDVGIPMTITIVPANPVRAIERITSANADEPAVYCNPHHMTETTPAVVLPSSGAPLDMDVESFRKLNQEDRQRAIARLLAVDGARERMAPNGSRTLVQALEAELAYQRGLVRQSAALASAGETKRVSKSKAKRDRSKGAHKPRDGGTATFKRSPEFQVRECGGVVSVDIGLYPSLIHKAMPKAKK